MEQYVNINKMFFMHIPVYCLLSTEKKIFSSILNHVFGSEPNQFFFFILEIQTQTKCDNKNIYFQKSAPTK